MWSVAFRSILFDLLIVIGSVAALSPENDRVFWFVVALLAIWGWPILLLIKRTIFVIINYKIDKRSRINAVLQDFKVNRYPKPEDFFADGTSFLLWVCESENSPASARRSAGINLGMLECSRYYHISDAAISNLVLDAAVEAWLGSSNSESGDLGSKP